MSKLGFTAMLSPTPLLALVATILIPRISGRAVSNHTKFLSGQSWNYDYYALNPGAIKTNLMVGALDGNGGRKPRQSCIFYVNQKDVDENIRSQLGQKSGGTVCRSDECCQPRLRLRAYLSCCQEYDKLIRAQAAHLMLVLSQRCTNSNSKLMTFVVDDVYDSAQAFNYLDDPMLSALEGGNLRDWFSITSGAYA